MCRMESECVPCRIDGMAVSRDNEIDAIVDRLVQISHYGTNVNTEQSDSSNESQQMEVLEAIRLSNDSLIPTLLRHSKLVVSPLFE